MADGYSTLSESTVDSELQDNSVTLEAVLEQEITQMILQDLYEMTKFPIALLNKNKEVVVAFGWNNCLPSFGRSCKDEFNECDALRGTNIHERESGKFIECQCPNGIRNVFFPLTIFDQVLGYVMLGHFLYEEDVEPNHDPKCHQGCEDWGGVSIFTREEVDKVVRLCCHAACYLSKQGSLNWSLIQEKLHHQNTEEKLKIQKTYFENLFDNSPDAIAILDNEDRIIQINNEFEKLFGYGRAEVEGRLINDLIVPEFSKEEGLQATHDAAVGKRIELTTVRRNKNGELIQVVILGSPILLRNNQLGVYGIYRDISNKLKIEQSQKMMYRISEAANSTRSQFELYRQITEELDKVVDGGEIFIEIYDRTNNVFLLPRLDEEEEEGYDRVAIDKTLSALVLDCGQLVSLTEDNIQDRISEKGINLKVTPQRWLGIPLIAEDEVIGVFGVQSFGETSQVSFEELRLLEFISAQIATAIRRKWGMQELRKLYRSLEQSPASVVITDLTGAIEYVNPKFCELSGYSYDEVIGQNPRILNSGLTPKDTYVTLWESILMGKEWSGGFLNRKKNGEVYWEKAYISPVKDELGKITHFIAVKEDVTQTKKYEQELLEAKERAEESDELKSAFLANMSHELRTPLNAVIGFSNLCDASLTKEEILEYVGLIHKSGNLLLSLIEDILNISLIESGKIRVRKEKFQLGKFMMDFQNVVHDKRANENKDHLDIHYRPDSRFKKIVVETDGRKLQQVLVNLVKNAFKFTEQGSVEYGYRVQEQNLVFYVKDTGIGIKEEQQRVIFEQFRQGDDSLTRRFGGTGLGLSISKRVVEMLGGRIWVESVPEMGSTFCVAIPCVKSIEGNLHLAEKYNALESKSRFTILVAEDESSNFKLIQTILQRNNFDVIRAENGLDAVNVCRKNSGIDLVLMDIKMPQMDGYEATQMIKRINPGLPVLALTAYAMDGDKERALLKGCDAYIAKPIKGEALLDFVRKHLR